MKTVKRYRQLVLLLVALMLPSLAVVLLGVRTVQQDRLLSAQREVERRQQAVVQVRQALHARLELALAKSRGDGSTDPAVAVLGWTAGDQLELPWDHDLRADHFRKSISSEPFALVIERAERAKQEKSYAVAEALYREALGLAADKSQSAHAMFLLTDVLETYRKPGRDVEVLYRTLLDLSFDVVDQNGTPFALYAAQRLLVSKKDAGQDVVRRLKREPYSVREWSPAQFYTLTQIVRTLERSVDPGVQSDAKTLSEALEDHDRFLHQALALQSDFRSLHLTPSMWLTYGEDPWLVGMSSMNANSKSLVIAVRAADIFPQVAADQSNALGIPLTIGAGPGSGEPLGEGLLGLNVVLGPLRDAGLERSSSARRSFYLVSLGLIVGMTMLAGYLLRRDMHRELALADLRSQFVSSVSHELRTPLTSIRMFAETLRIRKSDPKKSEEYLDTIIHESERLTRLLNNVLDFSRIERGQKNYQLLPTNLTDVVTSAARMMEYPLERQGFRLQLRVPATISPAYADRDAVEQAILNLLANAMKYSGPNRDIELHLMPENGNALIQVADYGIGIPENEHEKIFEKFYRAPTSSNQKIPGAGLGLALVAHIVKGHGGTVQVQSAPGKGSTFSIRLPLIVSGIGD